MKKPAPSYMDKGRPVLGGVKRALERVRGLYYRRAAAAFIQRDAAGLAARGNGRTRIAFALKEITYLKAFMPLIRLWEDRYEVVVFVFKGDEKATSPIRNLRYLEVLAPYRKVWFESARDVAETCGSEGIQNIFTLEAMPFGEEDYDDPGWRLYVITHMTDFNRTLDWYYEKAFAVLFQSRYMAGENSARDRDGKFVYPGYSQYLVLPDLDEKRILDKYGLPEGKRILFIFGPQKKFYRQTREIMDHLCEYARERDCFLVYKTRRKNPVPLYLRWRLRPFRTFYDESYFPPTSLELMHVSQAVVNFDSTGIQEIVMLEKKVLNFYLKRGYRGMPEIYEEPAVEDLAVGASREEVFRSLDRLVGADLSREMREIKMKYFLDERVIRENYLRLEESFLTD